MKVRALVKRRCPNCKIVKQGRGIRDLVEAVCKLIYQCAPDAFITIEDTQKVERGYLRAAHYDR